MLKWVIVAGASLAMLGNAAVAASIDIGGNFGDEPGCQFAANPDNFAGTEYTVLTPEEFKIGAMSCDFIDASPAWEKYGNRIFVVTAVCGHEGTDTTTTELLRVERLEEEGGYAVFAAAGGELGRGERCQ